MGETADQKLQTLEALGDRNSTAEIHHPRFPRGSLMIIIFLCRHFNIWRATHCAQEPEHTHSAADENRSEQSVTSIEEMQRWGTTFQELLQLWGDRSCETWCSWNDVKPNTEFLQATVSVDKSLQGVSICRDTGHVRGTTRCALSPLWAPTKPGPGVGPFTSRRAWSEMTAPSSPKHAASPCLLLPAPHHLQPPRANILPCSPGDGEFEQVQKAEKRPARDPYKILSQNTARRGRRGRKIKGADTTPFRTPN